MPGSYVQTGSRMSRGDGFSDSTGAISQTVADDLGLEHRTG
jgi:hypothetical protein